MQNLVRRVNSRRSKETGLVRGIITVVEDLEEVEFNSLLKAIQGEGIRICIIDSSISSPILGERDCIIRTPSLETDLHLSEDKAIDSLRTAPTYFIFKDLINRTNIKDIECCVSTGHNVICFTDLATPSLSNFVDSFLGRGHFDALVSTLGLY